jgi:hypothetical protein
LVDAEVGSGFQQSRGLTLAQSGPQGITGGRVSHPFRDMALAATELLSSRNVQAAAHL